MSIADLQPWVALGGLALAAVGLPILIVQIRELQKSVRSEAHAALYAQGADFRSHLVAYPHLRKYFFDRIDIAPGDPEYDRVVTIAELYLNCLEHIAVMEESFGRGNRESLERFIRHALDSSSVMRRRLTENRAAYSHALQRFI